MARARRSAAALCLGLALGPALLGCSDDGDDGGSRGEGDDGPAVTEPATDPQPAADAAAWLTGQLSGGLVRNEQYRTDDVGLTIDVALALDAVDDEAGVTQVADAVGRPAVLQAYTGTARTARYAGATAKAVLLAEVADRDPSVFGGLDLVAQLEGLVSTDAATSGRVADTGPEDYTTVVGQAYAAWALGGADSPAAADVSGYLLTQQCADGFFRAALPAAEAATQACDDDPASAPDVDTTALAVLALADLAEEDAEAASAVDLAVDWLLEAQTEDGSFTGEGEVANANSTGLAGWALGEVGETDAAASAAEWLRTLQVPADAAAPLAEDAGAVAYDVAALEVARTGGVVARTSDQWRRATAQALPGLALAPS